MATAKKPRASHKPENETPEQTFSRLVSARVTKAIKAIRGIAKLGNSKAERSQDQINRIVNAINAEVSKLPTALAPRVKGEKKAAEPLFTL